MFPSRHNQGFMRAADCVLEVRFVDPAFNAKATVWPGQLNRIPGPNHC